MDIKQATQVIDNLKISDEEKARARRIVDLLAIGLTREQAENLDDCVQEAAAAAFCEGSRVLQNVPEPLRDLAFAAFVGTLVASGTTFRKQISEAVQRTEKANRE